MNFKTILTSTAVLAAMAISSVAAEPETSKAIPEGAAKSLAEGRFFEAYRGYKRSEDKGSGDPATATDIAADQSSATQQPVADKAASDADKVFSYEERELLRSVAADVRAALAKAGLPGALPVSTLRSRATASAIWRASSRTPSPVPGSTTSKAAPTRCGTRSSPKSSGTTSRTTSSTRPH